MLASISNILIRKGCSSQARALALPSNILTREDCSPQARPLVSISNIVINKGAPPPRPARPHLPGARGVQARRRVPAGRPAVGRGRARGPPPVRVVRGGLPAEHHARARHAPAAVPQGRRTGNNLLLYTTRSTNKRTLVNKINNTPYSKSGAAHQGKYLNLTE